MKKQRIITVNEPLDKRVELTIVDEMAKEGWVVKELSSSTFTPNPEPGRYPKPYIAVTILFEKEA